MTKSIVLSLLWLSSIMNNVLSIFRIDRNEEGSFTPSNLHLYSGGRGVAYNPDLDKWYVAHSSGVFHTFTGKKSHSSSVSELVKFRVDSLNKNGISINHATSYLMPDEKELLFVNYKEMGIQKFLITEVNGAENTEVFNQPTFDSIAKKSFFLDDTKENYYFIGDNHLIKKIVLSTFTVTPFPALTAEEFQIITKVKSNKMIACHVFKTCKVIDLSTMTPSKTFVMASETDPDPNNHEFLIQTVTDYEQTFTTGGTKLFISFLNFKLSEQDPPVTQFEIVDYVGYPGVVNQVLEYGRVLQVHRVVGILGTPFLIINGYANILLLINPSQQVGSGNLQIFKELLFSDYNMRLYWFGLRNKRGLTYFHALTSGLTTADKYKHFPLVSRISICGGSGCNRCNTELSDCEECEPGIPLIKDPLYNDFYCLAACKDNIFERVSLPNKRCINCLTERDLDPEACYFTQNLYLKEINQYPLKNKNTSHTFELAFFNSSSLISRISEHINIGQSILAQLDNAETKDYNITLVRRENSLLIDLNLTKDIPSTKDLVLRVWTKQNIIHTNSFNKNVNLAFLDANFTLPFQPRQAVSEEKKQQMETLASGISTTASVVGNAGLAVGVVGVVFQAPTMPFLLKFILIMKILNRLKLLNIDYGEILGTFLSGIFNLFTVASPVIDEKSAVYATMTRGKLSIYNYDVLAFYKSMEKFILYMILFGLDVIRNKIWNYAKTLQNMLPQDQTFSIIVEKLKFLLFAAFVQDLMLFGFNEIVHHDMKISQESYSLTSWLIVFFCFCMLVYDICCYFEITYNQTKKTIARLPPVEKKGNLRSMSVFTKISKKTKKKQNTLVVTLSKKDQRHESFLHFCRQGIKPEKIDTKCAKYYNFLFLIRLVSFEPIFVSLQLLPTAQISLVFLVQVAFTFYSFYCVFKRKMFSNWTQAALLIVNETFIFYFMVLSIIAAFGGTRQMGISSWQTWQEVTVYIIIVVCSLNLLLFIINIIGAIRIMLQRKKIGENKTLIISTSGISVKGTRKTGLTSVHQKNTGSSKRWRQLVNPYVNRGIRKIQKSPDRVKAEHALMKKINKRKERRPRKERDKNGFTSDERRLQRDHIRGKKRNKLVSSSSRNRKKTNQR